MKTQKKAIRTLIASRHSSEQDHILAEEEAGIYRALFHWEPFRQSSVVHCYVSALPGEVNTRPVIEALLERGAEVQVPVTRPDDPVLDHRRLRSLDALRPAAFGLLEPDPQDSDPAEPARAELIIVPGRAFDRRGNRVGTGRGYYDRFLAEIGAPKAALAYHHQVLAVVPSGSHDVPLDHLIIEDAVINTREYR